MEKINVKNELDGQYINLLKDILDNGTKKQTRTGTDAISVFGKQIRHKMSDGFPLLTTKKMAWKQIVTELLWFLRGETNIKFLLDNDCNIWNGDAYKNYLVKTKNQIEDPNDLNWDLSSPKDPKITQLTQEQFINKIKTNDEFAKKWGSLGKIYGYQWRNWDGEIDQISELIRQLKDNPDSRRMIVSAWAVHDLPNMVLPPCHYGFQVYTRELTYKDRVALTMFEEIKKEHMDELGVPTRSISLMWNQRSVDTFLGLPFNIASYGLLLEIIAKAVNMVPDELIGNLGDVHLYSNHIEQAKLQIGRKYTPEERSSLLKEAMGYEAYNNAIEELMPFGGGLSMFYDLHKIPTHSREPFRLPTLNINTEFWPYEGGECGIGPLDAVAVFNSFTDDNFCKCLLEEDIQLSNYQSHPTIKAPLSN